MNEKITCIIVDDEPLAIKVIQNHISNINYLECLATFDSALEAFKWLKETKVELVFLDINMPHLTGLDLVNLLDDPPAIIFTTAYRNYAVESYELHAFDYLLKPIKFARLLKSVDRYRGQQNGITEKAKEEPVLAETKGTDFLYVNSNKKYIKVQFSEVLYIESIKDYIRIHCEKRNVITKQKISDFIEKLPNHFLRIHRSFIINADKVTAFTATDVEVEDKEIPIGVSYKGETMAYFKGNNL